MTTIGIIPARYASTRFPGKPLANINGKTMIQRVYEQAQKANLQQIVVATDDERILNHVLNFGGKAVITKESHPSGTDRCFEAYCTFDNPADFVVNIQGDEPFIQPSQINQLIEALTKPGAQIATLARKLTETDKILSADTVKLVMNLQHEALYFSRHPIPFIRGSQPGNWASQHSFYQHIGLYGYRADVLEQLVQLPVSDLEKCESLEQLRWLEHGYKIRVGITTEAAHGIDTPEDLEKVLALGLE